MVVHERFDELGFPAQAATIGDGFAGGQGAEFFDGQLFKKITIHGASFG